MHFSSTIVALISSLALVTAIPTPPNTPLEPTPFTAPCTHVGKNMPLTNPEAVHYHQGLGTIHDNVATFPRTVDKPAVHTEIADHHHDRVLMASEYDSISRLPTKKKAGDAHIRVVTGNLNVMPEHPDSLDYHLTWVREHVKHAARSQNLQRTALTYIQSGRNRSATYNKHANMIVAHHLCAIHHAELYRQAVDVHSKMEGGKHPLSNHVVDQGVIQSAVENQATGGHGAVIGLGHGAVMGLNQLTTVNGGNHTPGEHAPWALHVRVNQATGVHGLWREHGGGSGHGDGRA